MVVKRSPDVTRARLLEAAFEEIYQRGYQAASVDHILSATDLTKGALYHHFPNKAALGLAVIEEVIKPIKMEHWIAPLRGADDPIEAIIGILTGFSDEDRRNVCSKGCPLNNLAQEMSPIDEDFRHKIEEIYSLWRETLVAAFERGRLKGTVAEDVDCEKAAAFIIAALQGAVGLAKSSQDCSMLEACMEGLTRYLQSLRPVAVSA